MGKQTKKTTLRDYIHNSEESVSPIDAEKDGAKMEKLTRESDFTKATDFVWSNEFQNKIKDYNENMWPELDDLYTSFKPTVGMLVRVRLKTLRSQDGVIIPNVDSLAIPTRNGDGYVYNIPNPFCFSKEAIIISTPDHYGDDDFPVGARISINNKVRFVGKNTPAEDLKIDITGQFVHPSSDLSEMPSDPLNRHYGYLIINPRDGEFEGFL